MKSCGHEAEPKRIVVLNEVRKCRSADSTVNIVKLVCIVA